LLAACLAVDLARREVARRLDWLEADIVELATDALLCCDPLDLIQAVRLRGSTRHSTTVMVNVIVAASDVRRALAEIDVWASSSL
jgi:hypothetical protein